MIPCIEQQHDDNVQPGAGSITGDIAVHAGGVEPVGFHTVLTVYDFCVACTFTVYA